MRNHAAFFENLQYGRQEREQAVDLETGEIRKFAKFIRGLGYVGNLPPFRQVIAGVVAGLGAMAIGFGEGIHDRSFFKAPHLKRQVDIYRGYGRIGLQKPVPMKRDGLTQLMVSAVSFPAILIREAGEGIIDYLAYQIEEIKSQLDEVDYFQVPIK